jgi:hypothetical protein
MKAPALLKGSNAALRTANVHFQRSGCNLALFDSLMICSLEFIGKSTLLFILGELGTAEIQFGEAC